MWQHDRHPNPIYGLTKYCPAKNYAWWTSAWFYVFLCSFSFVRITKCVFTLVYITKFAAGTNYECSPYENVLLVATRLNNFVCLSSTNGCAFSIHQTVPYSKVQTINENKMFIPCVNLVQLQHTYKIQFSGLKFSGAVHPLSGSF